MSAVHPRPSVIYEIPEDPVSLALEHLFDHAAWTCGAAVVWLLVICWSRWTKHQAYTNGNWVTEGPNILICIWGLESHARLFEFCNRICGASDTFYPHLEASAFLGLLAFLIAVVATGCIIGHGDQFQSRHEAGCGYRKRGSHGRQAVCNEDPRALEKNRS